MTDFFLITENLSQDYIKYLNFYFKNFNFKNIKKEELKESTNNLIIINKELYPIKNFEEILQKIIKIKKFSFLSECKNIYYIPKKNVKFENNTLIISSNNNLENIFITSKYCPIRNENYKNISPEIIPFYKY